ncbi:poly [Carabus blaptoides fortunei]
MADTVLTHLDLNSQEKIIAIRENKLSDANFILTSLIAKTFSEQNTLCFIILHHTLGHYQNVGKRLGYDLIAQISAGQARVIEPMKQIVDDIANTIPVYLQQNKESVVRYLFDQIQQNIDELQKQNGGRVTSLVIDDISHLFDLGVDLKNVLRFLKYCNGLAFNSNVNVVVNCHVNTDIDEIIANLMFHSADVCVNVCALRTGRSRNVSGVLSVSKKTSTKTNIHQQNTYHFKLTDKDIKLFAPGRAII